MEKYDYFEKLDHNPYEDLIWNIPEQKTGTVAVIGGNSQSFATIAKVSEHLTSRFPLKTIRTVLPDKLKSKLPPLPDLFFMPSTDSGSFAKSDQLIETASDSGFTILLGDFSKNSATAIAITELIKRTDNPITITRDAVDLICSDANDFIERENVCYVATLSQLQKLFRAVYYPKVLLLSMPITQLAEALHKFTLSYPTTIVTFHVGQIVVAAKGQVISVPITNTNYSQLTIWQGQLASNIATLNFYNPNQPLESTVAALFYQ